MNNSYFYYNEIERVRLSTSSHECKLKLPTTTTISDVKESLDSLRSTSCLVSQLYSSYSPTCIEDDA